MEPRFYSKIVYDMRNDKMYRVPIDYRGPYDKLSPMVRPPKTIPSWDLIAQQANPGLPNQPEVIPWTWYDRITYTSGTTTSADFFTAVRADKVTGNMQAAGQLPAPMYFAVHHISFMPLLTVSAENIASATATDAGSANDMDALINSRLRLVIADKVYYEDKSYNCPAGAGTYAQMAGWGTYTAQALSTLQHGTNGVPDRRNRNYFWGMILIPHNQSWSITVNWTAAVTLDHGDTSIEISVDGYLYRRVL